MRQMISLLLGLAFVIMWLRYQVLPRNVVMIKAGNTCSDRMPVLIDARI